MCAAEYRYQKQQGFVLVFCLLTMTLLSLLALTAFRQAAMINKQVGSFKLAQELDSLEVLLKSAAISSLQKKHTVSFHAVDIKDTVNWQRLTLNTAIQTSAMYHAQQLDHYPLRSHSPKLNVYAGEQKRAWTYIFRITYRITINDSYERLGQFDYRQVRYE